MSHLVIKAEVNARNERCVGCYIGFKYKNWDALPGRSIPSMDADHNDSALESALSTAGKIVGDLDERLLDDYFRKHFYP